MKFRTQLYAGYIIVLILMLILIGVMYQATNTLIDSQKWVAHTHDVIAKGRLIEKLLVDMQTGERGFVIVGKEEFLEPYTAAVNEYTVVITDLKSLVSDNLAQVKKLEEINAIVMQWQNEMLLPIIASRREMNKTEDSAKNISDILQSGKGKTIMDSLRKHLSEFVNVEEGLLTTRNNKVQTSVTWSNNIVLFGTLISIVFGLMAMFLVARNVYRTVGGEPAVIAGIIEKVAQGNLNIKLEMDGTTATGIMKSIRNMIPVMQKMAEVTGDIARGDLTVKVNPLSAEDALGNSLVHMQKSLREQVQELITGINVLSSSASEIMTSTSQLATSSTETAASVTETTTTVEEAKQAVQMSNEKSQEVFEAAKKAAQVSQIGKQASENAIEGINRIRGQMDSIAESIVGLSEQSQAIAEITSSVEDLANQSNLLAVNASIEAAKAGDQGKGFAVVAQEVKNLADQSKQSTAQVRTILNDVQKAIGKVVMATEQGSNAVKEGINLAKEAGDAIQKLEQTVTGTAQASSQIAVSSQQQLIGMDQIASAMENIKQATNQNVSGTKQMEVSAQNLHELGQKLKDLVKRYKV